MKMLKWTFALVVYACFYLLFLAFTIIPFPQSSAAESSAAADFLLLLFPLIFPLIIWRFMRRIRSELAKTKGFSEKMTLFAPLFYFFCGYFLVYVGTDFVFDYPRLRSGEHPWIAWILLETASFMTGFVFAGWISLKDAFSTLGPILKKSKKIDRERELNAQAIHRLSSVAKHSDDPFNLMERRLPYPEKIRPGDLSPLLKSVQKRSIELKKVPPPSAQRNFKETFGLVCAPGEKFLFAYQYGNISIGEYQNTPAATTIGVGVPGPFGLSLGAGSSKFSNKESFKATEYGPGVVAVTTKNWYFQKNGIWVKVDRSRIISFADEYSAARITISDPFGRSDVVRLFFGDPEVSAMLKTVVADC